MSCVAEGAAPPARALAAIAALRQGVEAGPLYAVPAEAVGVAGCSHRWEAGTITLDYRFHGGGWLRVKRDDTIEYTEQDLRFAGPGTEPPEALLARAERAAFGADGCGIDWRKAERRRVPADPTGTDTETVFRGNVCNCQAIVRRDASGRTTGVVLRSAC